MAFRNGRLAGGVTQPRGDEMAKPDMYANPLIPLVLVAGILSGSLWRSNASPETGRTGEAGSSSTSGTSDRAHAPAPWISELRPALESLDDALGGHEGGVGRERPSLHHEVLDLLAARFGALRATHACASPRR